jgi:hypothetical protein
VSIDKYSADRPAATIAELRALAAAGATPEELLAAAGVAPEHIPDVLEDARRKLAILEHFQPGYIDAEMQRIEDVDARLRSGEPAADWGIILLGSDYSERERAEALARILDRMAGPPIHFKRWRVLRDAVAEQGMEMSGIIERDGLLAAVEAVGKMTPAETFADAGDDTAMKRFRAALQRLACDELPGWDWAAGKSREAPLHDDVRAIEDEALARVDARADVELLVERASLTPGERDVVVLDLEDLSTAEIAQRLDTTEDAVRRRRSDARRKIRSTLP